MTQELVRKSHAVIPEEREFADQLGGDKRRFSNVVGLSGGFLEYIISSGIPIKQNGEDKTLEVFANLRASGMEGPRSRNGVRSSMDEMMSGEEVIYN